MMAVTAGWAIPIAADSLIHFISINNFLFLSFCARAELR